MILGEVQLEKLEIRGTPPSTIHQKHSDIKRGQATYKRQRGEGFFLAIQQRSFIFNIEMKLAGCGLFYSPSQVNKNVF